MMNQPITPEELTYIDRYLQQELSAEELVDFRAKMENEPVFKEKVREVQLMQLAIGESTLEEKMNTFHQKMGEQSPKKSKVVRLNTWAVAASIVLVLSVSIWLIVSKYSHENNLYAAYYQPDPGLMTAMGTTDKYDFEKAMVAYRNGEYRQAIDAWGQQLKAAPSGDTLTYFLGAAYQAMGTADSAMIYLGKIAAQPESGFYKDANWYLGLLYLQTNKKTEAIPYLRLSGRDKAEELIQKLEK